MRARRSSRHASGIVLAASFLVVTLASSLETVAVMGEGNSAFTYGDIWTNNQTRRSTPSACTFGTFRGFIHPT
jgi:hypothetical protein